MLPISYCIDLTSFNILKTFCQSGSNIIIFFLALSSDVKLATTPDINLLYTSDNLFMQIVEPEEISYVYKIRPARNFGVDFVSIVERVGPSYTGLRQVPIFHQCIITLFYQNIKWYTKWSHASIIPSPWTYWWCSKKFHLKFVANDLD